MRKAFYILVLFVVGYVSYLIATPLTGIDAFVIEPIHFADETGNFRYTCYPAKGRDLDMMYRSLEDYKKKHGITRDVKVYRTRPKSLKRLLRKDPNYQSEEWQVEFKLILW